MNRQFKEETRMADKHIKRMLNFISDPSMQTKTIISHPKSKPTI